MEINRVKILFLCLLLILSAGRIKAQMIYEYSGMIGKEKIEFVFASNSAEGVQPADNIECAYFYLKDLKDIRLHCSITPDGKFTFEEFDAQKNVLVVFKGEILESDPGRLEGTWTKTGDTRSLPFSLRMMFG